MTTRTCDSSLCEWLNVRHQPHNNNNNNNNNVPVSATTTECVWMWEVKFFSHLPLPSQLQIDPRMPRLLNRCILEWSHSLPVGVCARSINRQTIFFESYVGKVACKNTQLTSIYCSSLVWWSGVVVSALASINEVNLRRTRLVLGDRVWVQFPVSGTYFGM